MNTDIFARFPAYDEQQLEAAIDQKNPAIRLYGRRFYKDQTPRLKVWAVVPWLSKANLALAYQPPIVHVTFPKIEWL